MENFTPGQLLLIAMGMLLAAASAINTLGSALEKIAKAKKAAQAPNEEQNRQIKELQEWRKEVDRKLRSDHQELREIRDGLGASCQVQLALLDHALHGNNVKQMQDARDALYNYMTHADHRKE